MQPKRMQDDEHPILGLVRWLDTPAGRYAQAWEQRQFSACVEDAFGYRAVQLGLPELDTLACNRMPLKLIAGDLLPAACHAWQGMVGCAPEELPFASQSLDLITLPHTLEFADDPHEVLREVERALIPEGRVVISGFNPWSLWGMRQRSLRRWRRPFLPEQGEFLSVRRLRDWLRLMSFEIDRGRFGCYVPALRSQAWIERMAFMDKAGDRWWPAAGSVYVISAVKRVKGLRVIGPAWKARKASRAAAVAVSRLG